MANRILVLGASGGCGKHVVTCAITGGHKVTALVRPETDYVPPDGVSLIRDDILREVQLPTRWSPR